MNNVFEKNFEKVTGKKFDMFYQTYYNKLVWHLNVNYLKDEDLAEEIANRAFMQGLNKIGQFNPNIAQIHTWIYTIGENMAKKFLKEKQKRGLISLEKEINDDSNLLNFLTYDESEPNFEYQELLSKKCDIIKDVIEKLPIRNREVIVMRELEGMSYQEIANELNRNLSTVKSQIKKGREIIIQKVKRKFDVLDKCGLR